MMIKIHQLQQEIYIMELNYILQLVQLVKLVFLEWLYFQDQVIHKLIYANPKQQVDMPFVQHTQ